jgi:hypothetical protein
MRNVVHAKPVDVMAELHRVQGAGASVDTVYGGVVTEARNAKGETVCGYYLRSRPSREDLSGCAWLTGALAQSRQTCSRHSTASSPWRSANGRRRRIET